ncbi:MAG: excinuclease ABC subunit B [Candidatus Moraniibacteriota bacterium]|nr:MAG: excinuclease ABC subunit B [Candidatus Moranbacteria bacterium]
MQKFDLHKHFEPTGDQPRAIEQLVDSVLSGSAAQTLLGVTGSGKTFTVANVIQEVQKPTLVIAHNKTLAAQLVQEFRTFFPQNAVEYFVSYYDYYQPEAYVHASDTYIDKEVEINEEIDRLRHAATAALLTRRDVIIVASVSCIYGLGSPAFYRDSMMTIRVGDVIDREDLLKKLIDLHYERSDILSRAKFRATGPTIDIVPAGREAIMRIMMRGTRVVRIMEIDLVSGEKRASFDEMIIYPAKHFVVTEPVLQSSLDQIQKDLTEQLAFFQKEGKLLEAQRLEIRTRQDIEMMKELGYCNGIENYSLYLTGREVGEAPYTLMDYFPEDYLLVIDESHVTVPQIGGMYNGDRARKQNLVDYGFRLPSALDNRPLNFDEFEKRMGQTIFVSATPAEYEQKKSTKMIEQIIRPTGLVDPELIIRPTNKQVQDVITEIGEVVKKGERVLITTLTKKQAEDLSEYLDENNIKSKYLHSDVDTLDRITILEELRRGVFDVLVGVNLLREGLDLPEVSLVAILDADKEGFLRSEVSLIQTIGRAARNAEGRVILYADKITGSLKKAIDETERRRKIQLQYNKEHNITPQTIKKHIESIVKNTPKDIKEKAKEFVTMARIENIDGYIKQREMDMKKAATSLNFEEAAMIRDEIKELRKMR